MYRIAWMPGDGIGAEVTGVDLSRPLDGADFEQIDLAINQYSLLLFENQRMNDDAQLAFTRCFGQLEEEHVSYYSHGKITYIGRVGNIDDDGNKVSARQIKSATGNEMWHADSSFREIPAMNSILCAYEVPAEAGETEFASARAAYRRLDQATRQGIDDMVGIHDYIYSRSKVGEGVVIGALGVVHIGLGFVQVDAQLRTAEATSRKEDATAARAAAPQQGGYLARVFGNRVHSFEAGDPRSHAPPTRGSLVMGI